MTVTEILKNCPDTISVGNDTAHLLTDRFATPRAQELDLPVLQRIDDRIDIVRLLAETRVRETADVLPCYQFAAEDIAVATGVVYVRLEESDSAESHREQLKTAGFKIQSIPVRQPHTAWLTSTSDSAADGIRNMQNLSELVAIAFFELQLLRPQRKRSSLSPPKP